MAGIVSLLVKPIAGDTRDVEDARMRLLVLGGTRFVGRAVIEEALVRGWDVTAVNRGITGGAGRGGGAAG